MQKMTGLDLEFSVADLAPLQGKRIAKIRRTGDGIFLFRIGSEELLFEPGIRLHLTRQALQATGRPDGFVSFLRKSMEGKTAARIGKVEGERIVEIETKSKERLVFELFRKGNLILVCEDGTIAACLEKDEAGGRKIARGERYAYPRAAPFSPKRPEKTAFLVQENESGEPVSYSCDSAAGGKAFPSFSEAADYYYANARKESGAERAARERVAMLEERLRLQRETLARMEGERRQAKEAGDAVYLRFPEMEELLSLARKLKKEGKSEGEINALLSQRKARLAGATLEVEPS